MSFRHWCCQKWYEHCDEFEFYTKARPDYDSKFYFSMHKYWLKREYKNVYSKTKVK